MRFFSLACILIFGSFTYNFCLMSMQHTAYVFIKNLVSMCKCIMDLKKKETKITKNKNNHETNLFIIEVNSNLLLTAI